MLFGLAITVPFLPQIADSNVCPLVEWPEIFELFRLSRPDRSGALPCRYTYRKAGESGENGEGTVPSHV